MSKPIVVLVVEDEPLIRMDIVDELSDRGFTVLEASNADKAKDLLDRFPEIQVMFTDVDMPGSMDGLKLAEAVRHRWPPIKIIVTSAHRKVALSDIPAEAKFFGKPYTANAIAGAVREMMA